MFAAWGRWVYRHRWATLLASAALLLVSILNLARGGTLTTGTIEGIEADRTQRLLEVSLGLPGDSAFTVLFHAPGWTWDDPRFASAMGAALRPLQNDPRVATVLAPPFLPPLVAERLLSQDRRWALAVVSVKGDVRQAVKLYPDLRKKVQAGPLQIHFTGRLAFVSDLDDTLEKDLLRAELVSLPLALLVLLAVFGTLAAASLPVGVGGLAVLGGVSVVLALSRHTDMAQYTLNVVSLIGLGVAIDYSLFIVSRYRDELAAGATYQQALVTAVQTAGRAVAFSGLAVGIGLSGLLFFPHSYLSAMGLAGAVVVALAVLFALSFLPALLAVLERRIHAGRIGKRLAHQPHQGLWYQVAGWVMRHPLLVLLPTLGLILVMGHPFLRLRLAMTDVTVLPPGAEARQGFEELKRHFPREAQTRLLVAVQFPTAPAFAPDRVRALYDASRHFAALPGVSSVQSIVDLDPKLTRDDYVEMASTPLSELPPEFPYALHSFASDKVALLAVLTDAPPSSTEARQLVRAMRAHRAVGDGWLMVGGQTAHDVDATDFIVARAPRAVMFVMAMTYLVLFLLLGSVVLPLKAVVMNLLSIAGSFGALVWIFQDGHLRGLLHFEPRPIEPALPVLLFCTVFGLSMDYEVLLLSRIQEEFLRSRNNARSVAEGLERSAGLITSAAAIMVTVFAAFVLARVVVVQAMGVGMAVAVALDATLVRVLLVPATMRLFGNLNWWAPAPVARLFASWRARGHNPVH